MKNPLFLTTRWTLVASAGGGESRPAEVALEAICQAYWFPLYAFVRRYGHTREQAEDLTQAFFMDLLERKPWQQLDQERGKFRAFLLAALKNFLANHRETTRCQKRGGDASHISLDWRNADSRFHLADDSHSAPDHAYDREWGVQLLELVLGHLRDEAAAEGSEDRFEILKDFLNTAGSEASYAEVAEILGITPGAARVAVHRLRKRYRHLLRVEIARTLADPAMVDEELRSLFAAFRPD
ncbi:RNA polymerase sigma factor [Luteolibacter yonseiensis]|uniref:RNA polymerase sigma factor n=1 Tax=Luteolibacter yonseiensis TaxID=1144680 RepID=UPI001F43F573|nr:sigma-70 family RNA polymerase sigma factor [Luteolibacter yonseiensis]